MSELHVRQVLWRAVVDYGELAYQEWRVVRVTPAGGWAVHRLTHYQHGTDGGSGKEKWTPAQGRYLTPSREAALRSLKIRTSRYIDHSQRRLADAVYRAGLLGVDVPLDVAAFVKALNPSGNDFFELGDEIAF